jgi:tetratricopeptide (TPR) repeat protein
MSDKETKKDMRRPITDEFIDSEGKKQIRSTSVDFQTLPFRHIEIIWNLRGFQQDKKLVDLMGKAKGRYDAGWYSEALDYLNKSLERMPELESYIFYYIRVCKQVLAVPLTEEEKRYEEERKHYRSRLKSLPRWLWWIVPKVQNRIRCKWCGEYTRFIHPDVPTFGFATYENSCDNCEGMYPMPSWMWDGPDGRAYSYYRMSFAPENKQFYDEFLRDYKPQPLVENSRFYKK